MLKNQREMRTQRLQLIAAKRGRRAKARTIAALAGALGLITLFGCSPKPVTTDVKQVVNGLNVEVTSNPPEPHTGDNDIELNIRDATTGMPVVDANVAGTATMTAPNVQGPTQTGRSKGNGLYEIPVEFAAVSSYAISIQIDRPGHTTTDLNITIDVEH
jgi:hypothetical protein